MPFGLQGSSSVLMRVMNDAMTRGLHGPASDPAPTPPAARPGVPGPHGPLHRSIVLYMYDLLCCSPSLGQHLSDVREVLSILRQEKLYVKASKRAFGRAQLASLAIGSRQRGWQ